MDQKVQNPKFSIGWTRRFRILDEFSFDAEAIGSCLHSLGIATFDLLSFVKNLSSEAVINFCLGNCFLFEEPSLGIYLILPSQVMGARTKAILK